MCSVCWKWQDSVEASTAQLLIIFNRDEQKTRAIANPPESIRVGASTALMPIDPDKGGSWIATNEYGLTIALLNNYEVLPDKATKYESRGIVVKNLSKCCTLPELEESLRAMLLEKAYPAFSLLIWETKSRLVQMYKWDENSLVLSSPQASFFTSSSWNSEAVQNYRTDSYVNAVINNEVPIRTFMSSVARGREKWSVYMEREQTQTVSVSTIKVYGTETHFTYYDRVSDKKSLNKLEFTTG